MKLTPRDLKFVIVDRPKLSNNQADYDSIGIQWKDGNYKIGFQDDMVLPLMKFIDRRSPIAYTVPVAGFDEEYFEANGLVDFSDRGFAYAAKEFSAESNLETLDSADFSLTVDLPTALAKQIIERTNNLMIVLPDPGGTYVNADFDVKYQVFLEDGGGKRVADVGGLPLRYYWESEPRKKVQIIEVSIFAFPDEPFGDQDRAVIFFQTAAILRQFKLNNPTEFSRFKRDLEAAEAGLELPKAPARPVRRRR
jgi:hypothetical protein